MGRHHKDFTSMYCTPVDTEITYLCMISAVSIKQHIKHDLRVKGGATIGAGGIYPPTFASAGAKGGQNQKIFSLAE